MSSAVRFARLPAAQARAAIARAMSEDELLELVRDAAKALGWRFFHVFDSRRSVAGFPDVVLAGHGRVIWIELKTEKGRLSPAQRQWGFDLQACGQDWRLVRPSNVDELLADMRRP